MAQDQGLFGATPDAIRRSIMQERLAQAQMIGSLGPAGRGAMAGGHAGRAVLGLLGQDTTDPRLRKAKAMQEIQAQLQQMGLQPGTTAFTKAVGKVVTMQLGVGEGARAQQAAQELEKQRFEIEAVRNPPSVAAAQNRLQALIQVAQMSPGAAEVIAPMKEVSEAVLKGILSPADMNAKIEQALYATGGDEDAARKLLRKNLEGKPLVSITNEGKVEQITAETTARALATAAAGKKVSLENAGPVLREYITVLKNRPPITDVGKFAQWVADIKAKEGTAGQAYARLANPAGIVTDKDVEQAIKNLPGIGNYGLNNLDSAIASLEAFTSMKFEQSKAASSTDDELKKRLGIK